MSGALTLTRRLSRWRHGILIGRESCRTLYQVFIRASNMEKAIRDIQFSCSNPIIERLVKSAMELTSVQDGSGLIHDTAFRLTFGVVIDIRDLCRNEMSKKGRRTNDVPHITIILPCVKHG